MRFESPDCIRSLAASGRGSSLDRLGHITHMEQFETRTRGFRWRLTTAALAPFVASSVYLIFSRWPSYRFTTFGDYVSLVVSIIIGAAFVATLPISLRQRLLWLLIYIPVCGAVLFFFTFLLIAVIFHEGL
jgi:hypothetical protein